MCLFISNYSYKNIAVGGGGDMLKVVVIVVVEVIGVVTALVEKMVV